MDLLENQLDPRGSIAFRGGSVPDFLRKPIATCDFPGGPFTLWIRLIRPFPVNIIKQGTIGTPTKHRPNGVPLMGQWWSDTVSD